MAFSVHCSDGHAQESRLPLLFFFPVREALSELDSTVKAIATEMPQGDDQQREIIATAKQRESLMLSRFRGDKRPEESGQAGIKEESETTEWWELKQESEANDSDMPGVCLSNGILLKPDTRYCFSPAPGVEAKAYSRAASDDSADSEDSGSEESGTSDENSDNRPDEADADSDVLYVTTTLNPFPVSNEISQYCATLALKKIKQEPVSDSEIATESEIDVTAANPVNHLKISACSTEQAGPLKRHQQTHLPVDQRLRMHQCDHQGCNYSTRHVGHLIRHKRAHMANDKKVKKNKVQQHCDHEGCNYSTDHTGNLKMHKRTHWPADLRAKVHQCEHENCHFSTKHMGHLKAHKRNHWRPKSPRMRQCDHEGCNYSTDHPGHLKAHKQIHLPADQRPKMLRCDHEGCNYRTDHKGNLKKHKHIHLPVDQRPKRKAYNQLPPSKKRKKGDKE